jgi:hypothetical protein
MGEHYLFGKRVGNIITLMKSRSGMLNMHGREQKCLSIIGLNTCREESILKTHEEMKNNIEMDFTEIQWEVMDSIHLPQNWNQWWALVNTGSITDKEFLTGATISISRHTAPWS